MGDILAPYTVFVLLGAEAYTKASEIEEAAKIASNNA